MRVLKGKEQIYADINAIASSYQKVIIDIGTGDGRYIFKLAQEHKENFYIGVDPVADNMAEYAKKSAKKILKGGLPNVCYIVASIESIPVELYDTASKIYINLPWGSLLEGMMKGTDCVLGNIVRLAKPPLAELEICVSYSSQYEASEIEKRRLPELSIQYINTALRELYQSKGIFINRVEALGNDSLKSVSTKWAKRLGYGKNRNIYRLSATIKKE